ncbi:MAG: TonB-dependent receptor [Flavobacteriales bacterium]|nr:TonB-dependent receptor [Flavobacteriales bacterium]
MIQRWISGMLPSFTKEGCPKGTGWFLFSVFLFPFSGFGQNCSLSISGSLADEGTGIPMAYGTVYVEELQSGVAADSSGNFRLTNLCKGSYHLRFNHIGCETHTVFIDLKKDTTIAISMHHHNELVDEVVVHDHHSQQETAASTTINQETITEEANKDLSEMLQQMTGVSSLRTGAGVSKPVVHGLTGNRVAVLNNGVAQSGQQWGNDHAPEIDPYVAEHISVVKGASALAYPGNSLGSVVLIEPSEIANDPHLHGNVNYVFQTNGLGHTLNARLEKYAKWAAWRVSATAKVFGDRSAPDYYLTNTGKREYDVAAQLEKHISSKWEMKFYYSLFNTEIGILRGSHIGNLTDLQEAIGRDVPFFTKDTFSYKINAPHQTVQHHLAKLQSRHIFNEHQTLRLTYAAQVNNRKEFDIRRGDRSNTPALSLLLWDQFLESVYDHFFEHDRKLKTGIQLRITDNTNNPETGILPLIPDYRAYRAGAFAIFQEQKGHVLYELGARYDLTDLQVVAISSSLPREIERHYHVFNNYSLSAGMRWQVLPQLKLNLDMGHVLRSPQVNELYSNGLHQGVSGIELGNPNLKSERSSKVVLTADWNVRKKLFVQVLGYYQYVQDFIYLQPESEFRLTIRGAFPLYSYHQTDATLIGTDVLASYEPIESIRLMVKYSFLQGDDVRNHKPLVYMPSNNLFGSFAYTFKDGKKMKNSSVSINGRYVFKQNHLNADQDIMPVPNGYFLLGANLGTSFKLKKATLRCSLRGENLLNTRYRDYLNRQRYFSDDLGWNVSAQIGVTF